MSLTVPVVRPEHKHSAALKRINIRWEADVRDKIPAHIDAHSDTWWVKDKDQGKAPSGWSHDATWQDRRTRRSVLCQYDRDTAVSAGVSELGKAPADIWYFGRRPLPKLEKLLTTGDAR